MFFYCCNLEDSTYPKYILEPRLILALLRTKLVLDHKKQSNYNRNNTSYQNQEVLFFQATFILSSTKGIDPTRKTSCLG